MGLSQWIYSLDSHYENSSTISDKCRKILKNCVDCIDNIYVNTPEILTRESSEFIEIEVPEIHSVIDKFEIELKTLEQHNKKALILMETLSACNGIDGIPEQRFNEVREKTCIELERSYSTYRRRLELFMPTLNQLAERIQSKINEINERIEKINTEEVDDVDDVEVDFEVDDYEGNLN